MRPPSALNYARSRWSLVPSEDPHPFNFEECDPEALLESYVYDEADNRLDVQRPSEDWMYEPNGNVLGAVTEVGLGRLVRYKYEAGAGGRRAADSENAAIKNVREYVYDGDGRLSVMLILRAGQEPGSDQEEHTLSILYDHRSRPLVVVDKNETTGEESHWQYYWDRSDRLINLVNTPAAVSDPDCQVIDSFVHVEPMFIGRDRVETAEGGAPESFVYYATDPVGLPVAAYEFGVSTLQTTEVWRAQWSPFGTRVDAIDPDAEQTLSWFSVNATSVDDSIVFEAGVPLPLPDVAGDELRVG